MIEPKLLVRSGLAVSFIGHVVVLALGLLFAGANPFDQAPTEAISVDIVSSDEIDRPAAAPETTTTTTAPAPLPSANTDTEAAAQSPQVPPPAAQYTTRQVATPPRPLPNGQFGASPSAPPESQPREPAIADMFGLPLTLPDGRLGGGFDAPAIDAANVSADNIAAFRQHLKTCLTRPTSVTPTDKVRVVLRVALKPDGMLAAAPTLIEASASAKGPLLMASAINGLQACQPYAMLPAEKYQEWKVLDLSFTPRDFAGG